MATEKSQVFDLAEDDNSYACAWVFVLWWGGFGKCMFCCFLWVSKTRWLQRQILFHLGLWRANQTLFSCLSWLIQVKYRSAAGQPDCPGCSSCCERTMMEPLPYQISRFGDSMCYISCRFANRTLLRIMGPNVPLLFLQKKLQPRLAVALAPIILAWIPWSKQRPIRGFQSLLPLRCGTCWCCSLWSVQWSFLPSCRAPRKKTEKPVADRNRPAVQLTWNRKSCEQ